MFRICIRIRILTLLSATLHVQREHGVLHNGQADGLPLRDHGGGQPGVHHRGAHPQDPRAHGRAQGHLHDLERARRFPPHRYVFKLSLTLDRKGLKCYGWIGLGEYKVPKWCKDLSSPSGMATCTALHAIRRFHMQY